MLELVRHRLRQWKERAGGGNPGGGAAEDRYTCASRSDVSEATAGLACWRDTDGGSVKSPKNRSNWLELSISADGKCSALGRIRSN
ncbi:hypothetical protein GRJ2_001621800 [Grus japonensis]|uniref:Uncharacterized protein n=1 Tax=Grus japonensis TaxID=30415 RepID=A0ABC9X2V2_GRUJA